jgi:hypothetical protein
MKLVTIVVTRSKSCHVKTLHTILRLNIKCIQNNVDHQILYVNDDPYEKVDIVEQCMKKYDRILFIDFGIGVDDTSLNKVLEVHHNTGLLVFPGVKEGVNWDMFREKVKSGSTEPVSQMGLEFDTVLGKKTSQHFYTVVSTSAKVWVMMPATIIRQIKHKKKNTWKLYPNMFEKFIEQGVKIYAFSASKLIQTYTHECVSNILNAASVKLN